MTTSVLFDPQHGHFWFSLRYDLAGDGGVKRRCEIVAGPITRRREDAERLYLRADSGQHDTVDSGDQRPDVPSGEGSPDVPSGEWRSAEGVAADGPVLFGLFAPDIEAIFGEAMARIAAVVVPAGPIVLKDGLRGELGFSIARGSELRPADAVIFTIRPLDARIDFLRSWRYTFGWDSGGGVMPNDDSAEWAAIQDRIDEHVGPEVKTLFARLEVAYDELVARATDLAA